MNENTEKTFTQEEVNNIISKRLGEEKTKAESLIAEKETELQARELRLEAREMLQKKGLSTDLVDALNLSSKESFEKSLSILDSQLESERKKVAERPPMYPAGTGKTPMYGNFEDDSIRKAMKLQK